MGTARPEPGSGRRRRRILLTLAVTVPAALWAVPPAASAAPPACTITGTIHRDTLVGTSGDDVICGLSGNDRLAGLGGDDTLVGGYGSDVLVGGSGDDTLEGGRGIDTASFAASGNPVRASLRTGTATGVGSDTLAGVEELAGSRFPDRLVGSDGPNRLGGGGGADTLLGLGGSDRLAGGDGPDTILGLDGSDTIEGGAGRNHMNGGRGIDTCVQQTGTGVTAHCERRWRPVVFATAMGLALYQPAAHPVRITYHESLFDPAIGMRPRGHLLVNANPRKFHPPARTPGPGYIVMGPRGRPHPATSASDDVMRAHTPVLAPVSGLVVSVTPYVLYCEAYDLRIIIRPDDRPEFNVVMFHVDDVRVHPGQHIVYSATVMGIPRVFPGSTPQTDSFVPGRHPHVHIEVERNRTNPVPGCSL